MSCLQGLLCASCGEEQARGNDGAARSSSVPPKPNFSLSLVFENEAVDVVELPRYHLRILPLSKYSEV